MKKTSPEVLELKKQVEARLNRRIKTPKDFLFLRSAIWDINHEIISATTLKRLWGYIQGADETRCSTLDILSRFLDFKDWEDYLNHIDQSDGSNPIRSFHISSDTLKTGDRLSISWKPDRRCILRYLGNSEFVVEMAENSKLQVGDTFSATLFILNEPLYLNNYVHDGNPPVPFVVGNRDGLCELKQII
ncbi:MAG: hypothetical protein IKX67_06355 [Bacteroidales bacterium]|nr:hypothetical protein [Bacteroidales bacterium]